MLVLFHDCAKCIEISPQELNSLSWCGQRLISTSTVQSYLTSGIDIGSSMQWSLNQGADWRDLGNNSECVSNISDVHLSLQGHCSQDFYYYQHSQKGITPCLGKLFIEQASKHYSVVVYTAAMFASIKIYKYTFKWRQKVFLVVLGLDLKLLFRGCNRLC